MQTTPARKNVLPGTSLPMNTTPSAPRRPAPAPAVYGGKAGEWTRMDHGRYSAWGYVALAFLAQGAIFGGLLAAGLSALHVHEQYVPFPAIVFGAAVAMVTFWDRWRCIEAFSSRFCAGIMNLSLLYVPVVAWVYANVRALQKPFGK